MERKYLLFSPPEQPGTTGWNAKCIPLRAAGHSPPGRFLLHRRPWRMSSLCIAMSCAVKRRGMRMAAAKSALSAFIWQRGFSPEEKAQSWRLSRAVVKKWIKAPSVWRLFSLSAVSTRVGWRLPTVWSASILPDDRSLLKISPGRAGAGSVLRGGALDGSWGGTRRSLSPYRQPEGFLRPFCLHFLCTTAYAAIRYRLPPFLYLLRGQTLCRHSAAPGLQSPALLNRYIPHEKIDYFEKDEVPASWQ